MAISSPARFIRFARFAVGTTRPSASPMPRPRTSPSDGSSGVKDIARIAGVAAGTFYLHFRDKQALFREIVFEALATLEERLQRATEGAEDPHEAVREMIAFIEGAISRSDEVDRLLKIRKRASVLVEVA